MRLSASLLNLIEWKARPLLIPFFNYYSVALAIDSPELFNRIAEVFCDKASIRFLILLWGDKTSLSIEETEDMPIFCYNEIIILGQDSRKSLLDSKDTCKLLMSSLYWVFLADHRALGSLFTERIYFSVKTNYSIIGCLRLL